MTRMQQRRDTAANWTSTNPILLSGEIGFETNTNKFKIGDGTTVWSSLAYILAGTYLGLHAKADDSDLLDGHDTAYFQVALGFTPEDVANKSTNISGDGASNTKYPGVKAIKDYVDGLVVGLLDYRGVYDASGNAYPATGGSGTAGAVLKGDMWVISVAGTMGTNVVQVGDSIIANVDTPAQTDSKWNVLNGNVAYVPEDSANKVTSISGSSTDVQYPSAKLLYDQLLAKQGLGSVSDKTDNYQVTNADFGKVLTMNYATLKTFTLPTSANIAAYLGQIITFVKKGAGKVVIQANTGQFIDDSSSAGTIYDDQVAELTSTITLLAISTTQWVIVGANGIWITN